MPHHMELRSVTRRCGGLSLDVDAPNEGKKKRKRNDLDREEALFISKDIQSGERVLYLQEVPKIKASHCRAWSCILERRTHEPIIRSYYRFALKGRPNTYGVERVEYYHITCLERIIPDFANFLRAGHLKIDGWIAGPPGSKVSIESSTKAIQDWFQYEGRVFNISCYERFKKDHEKWLSDSSAGQIEHQLGHGDKPRHGCDICEGVPMPKEPHRMDYFPQVPYPISLSRLLAIVSGQPHIDKWWRWQGIQAV